MRLSGARNHATPVLLRMSILQIHTLLPYVTRVIHNVTTHLRVLVRTWAAKGLAATVSIQDSIECSSDCKTVLVTPKLRAQLYNLRDALCTVPFARKLSLQAHLCRLQTRETNCDVEPGGGICHENRLRHRCAPQEVRLERFENEKVWVLYCYS